MVDANLATSAWGPVAVEEATGDVDLAGPVEVDGEDVTGTAPSVLADGDDRSERSVADVCAAVAFDVQVSRSEEHTSELQSLMRISYAVFCLKQQNISSSPSHAANH